MPVGILSSRQVMGSSQNPSCCRTPTQSKLDSDYVDTLGKVMGVEVFLGIFLSRDYESSWEMARNTQG